MLKISFGYVFMNCEAGLKILFVACPGKIFYFEKLLFSVYFGVNCLLNFILYTLA